jgi:hypothetical protein
VTMKSFFATTHIQAPQDAIWTLLTDAGGWSRWNPTIERVEGRIALGEQVTVYTTVSPGHAFPVRVTELEPSRRMVWSAGMPLGLFRGERVYTLSPRDGGVEFTMRERFTGLLAPFMTRSIPDLQPAFDAFASSLKRRAETGA